MLEGEGLAWTRDSRNRRSHYVKEKRPARVGPALAPITKNLTKATT